MAAKEATPSVEGNSIKRFLFTAETFEAVQAELAKRGFVIANVPAAPAIGGTTRAEGISRERLQTQFAIDRVAGRFHVYIQYRRPQHPFGSMPYLSQDVVFNTPDQGVSPIGTLTYPKSGGPFPAVVLVAGTGPHTRDAGMSLHKTLLVLADYLTRQGFAVLRYDKRGVSLTGGKLHPLSTTDEYASDALAAVRFLKMQPNVNPTQVGVIGHSEGGIIAAMVAAQAPQDVSFAVMLAGTGLPGIDLKILQDTAARRADGVPEDLILLNQNLDRKLYEIALSKRTKSEAIAAMHSVIAGLSDESKNALEIPANGLPDEIFEEMLSPWFRRFLELDPRPYLQKVTCPVLALVGDKDLQVPPKENLHEIELALNNSGPQTMVRQLPNLNHNFQNAKTGRTSEYLAIEETFSPSALALISDWILNVSHRKR
jgi:pimeloyl-ACP methyl ester carboxylesterase